MADLPDPITVEFDSQAPEEMQGAIYDYVNTYFPDWKPREGGLFTVQTEGITNLLFDLFTLASQMPLQALAVLAQLMNVQQETAAAATALFTVDVIDAQGYTVDAGTVFSFDLDENTVVGFQTLADVVIPTGSTSTQPGEVVATAMTDGTIGNGFTGEAHIETEFDFLTAATVIAPTTGGIDTEDFDTFMARFQTRLQILGESVVNSDNVVNWVISTISGIGRVLAIDNFLPPSTFDAERAIGVTALDESFNPIASGSAKALEVISGLAARREPGFQFNWIDVTSTDLDIVIHVQAYPNYDVDMVAAAVLQMVQDFFSNENWGAPPSPSIGTQVWFNKANVKYGELYGVIGRTPGVNFIDTLTIALHGNAQGTADLVLPGTVPLPHIDPANVTITVDPAT